MINNLLNANGVPAAFQRPAQPVANRANSASANGLSFDNLLNSRREEVVTRQRAERPTQSDNGESALHGDNLAQAQPPVDTNQAQTQSQTGETAAIGDDGEVADVAAIDEVAEEVAVIPLYELENAILAELAAILGIEPSELAELMTALGIALPELADADAQKELLLAIHGMDSEVALLSVPDALPMMHEMTAVVEELVKVLPQYAEYAVLNNEAQVALENAELAELATLAEIEVEATTVTAVAANTGGTDVFADADAQTAETAPIAIENTSTALPFNPNLTADVLNTAATTEAQATMATATQAPVDPQNIMEQIVNNMHFEVRGAVSEIRIQLRPEHLGDVTLRVSTQNGIVVAQFVAENQRVKEIIEAGFNQLRDALEEQGINISEIEVSVGQGENEREFAFTANTNRSIPEGDVDGLLADELETAETIIEPGLEDGTVDYRA